MSLPLRSKRFKIVEEVKSVASFRDLMVWQKAMQLTVKVYRLTKEFPREELYGLTGQIRRSALSLPSNIAEGHGRLTKGEFRPFLGIARGSNFELQTQLQIARELEMGNSDLLTEAESLSNGVGRMLFAIISSTKANA